jgi:hypothetical protein
MHGTARNEPLGKIPRGRKKQPPELTVELEAALVRQLGKSYDYFNSIYFKNRLRRPVIGLLGDFQHLGRWDLNTRTLEIARSLFVKHGWGVAVEVLKHEMAHQFVDEIIGARGESSHGPEFRRVCEERGIDYRASGIPGSGVVDNERKRVLERIAKLLALAESPNLHEAQSAMSAAQRLILRYNVETDQTNAVNNYSFRHLGKPTGRLDESQRILSRIVNEHFFVETIWVPVWRPFEAKRGSVLEVCGTETNLEIAEYVYDFLNETAERLWRNYQHERSVTGNRDRRSFIAGVMTGFREKLDEQRVQSSGEGLIWVGDANLGQYFKRRYPYTRTIRHAARGRPLAHKHGRAAGKQIVLHRAVKHGESGTVRLLNASNR